VSRETLPPTTSGVLPPACKAHGCRVEVARDVAGIAVSHSAPGAPASAFFAFDPARDLWPDVLDWLADQHQGEAG
jgi:hypothetical protein